MEVRGQNSDLSKPALRRFQELRAEIARRDAAKVRQARDTLEELSQERQEVQRATREDAARRAEAAEASKAEVQATRERATTRPQRDTIEISAAAREAAELASRTAEDGARAERVAQLRQEHESGQLNTPERIERAAQRLLGAD